MASINGTAIRKVVVACDAGMGSSVMLASQLRRLLNNIVTVVHTPVNSIPADADVIVVHKGLADRARVSAPGKVIVPVQVFIGDPAVTAVVNAVRNGTDLHG